MGTHFDFVLVFLVQFFVSLCNLVTVPFAAHAWVDLYAHSVD